MARPLITQSCQLYSDPITGLKSSRRRQFLTTSNRPSPHKYLHLYPIGTPQNPLQTPLVYEIIIPDAPLFLDLTAFLKAPGIAAKK
jgi:hypothetical protein